ncbi:MAG: cell division protein FtsZ, partial [Chitinophagaceae bacterium]|nr:cell division protein FtsZ [Chitinophagaceae bacterium]
LTVGIVTTPFSFEGKKRNNHSDEGIEQLKRSVDCLLVINNDKIKEMYGNLPIRTAFSYANDILTVAAKGIAEIITHPGYINVDFEDVKTVMRNSGVALMGSASAEGENRATEAVKAALASPLLNDNQIHGAKNILLNISFGASEVLMDEIDMITSYIQEEAGQSADIIFGTSIDESLENKIAVTLICTGFESRENKITYIQKQQEKNNTTKHALYEDVVNTNISTDTITAQKSENIVEETPENIANEVLPIVHELKLEDTVEPVTNSVDNKIEETEVNSEEPFMKINDEVENLDIPEAIADTLVTELGNTEDQLNMKITDDLNFEFEIEEENNAEIINQEEKIKQSIARLRKIKDLNLQINSPVGLRDLEKEPAYVRKQKKLNDVPHSSENAVSRLSLFDDGTNNGIRTNNSFLHDNVD